MKPVNENLMHVTGQLPSEQVFPSRARQPPGFSSLTFDDVQRIIGRWVIIDTLFEGIP